MVLGQKESRHRVEGKQTAAVMRVGCRPQEAIPWQRQAPSQKKRNRELCQMAKGLWVIREIRPQWRVKSDFRIPTNVICDFK